MSIVGKHNEIQAQAISNGIFYNNLANFLMNETTGNFGQRKASRVFLDDTKQCEFVVVHETAQWWVVDSLIDR